MSLTCVSCYFPVNNKHGNKYKEWFKNTLSINCPYVFFTNKNNIELIQHFRQKLPTYYVVCEINDFYTFRYKHRMITDTTHCPSVELNLIWNEKIFMIQKAYQLNPFNSEWFKWIDSGICIYRDIKPPNREFPNKTKLNALPKDKFIYCSSNQYQHTEVSNTNYYHHVSGNFLMNKNIIDNFTSIYAYYLDKLVDKKNIWTEQFILTHIYKNNPSLFYKLCDGYGSITASLF
jgi:hypothetical protein